MSVTPDVTQASGLFWATVFGAALGVVAGTVIQYFLSLALERRSKDRQRKALIKEMIYNKSLVDELSKEAQKLRNAVNGGVLNKYFGYLSFEKAIFAQANARAADGILYELLSADDIRHVQRIVSTLSVNNANWVNGEITRRRNAMINAPDQFDQGEVVSFVDFVENSIRDLGQWIDAIIRKLES